MNGFDYSAARMNLGEKRCAVQMDWAVERVDGFGYWACGWIWLLSMWMDVAIERVDRFGY